jgi:hypothetical protein
VNPVSPEEAVDQLLHRLTPEADHALDDRSEVRR